MTEPRPLRPGDRIAILSPASSIDPALVDGAAATLRREGYEPVVMPHALGSSGSYSAPAPKRLADLAAAIADPSVRAILCSRGGYGCVHLLESLDRLPIEADPKWLIGFSDISALHALWARHGIISLHSSMARQLALAPADPNTRLMFNLLTGGRNHFSATWDSPVGLNRPGEACGELRGGNLAVLDALTGTPFDDLLPSTILFIEDVAEPIYKVERMLYHLKLAGRLDAVKGLIIGRFTDYRPDRNHESMEEMIAALTASLQCPVAFGAPVGHIGPANLPLLHGAPGRLSVTPSAATLSYE